MTQQTEPKADGLVERLRKAMERAEPLPWAWEQCGEKEDCPVVGVVFNRADAPLAGRIDDSDYGDDENSLIRFNIASDWGSGINSTAPSANAAFVVEAVNALPALLAELEALRTPSPPQADERLREALEPFACDGFEQPVADESGWTEFGLSWCRERIVDWFGPSDFRRAATALQPKEPTNERG